jgi:hypothetical protein
MVVGSSRRVHRVRGPVPTRLGASPNACVARHRAAARTVSAEFIRASEPTEGEPPEFEKTLELQAGDHDAIRRLGIAVVYRSRYEEGLRTFRQVPPQANSALWHYHVS